MSTALVHENVVSTYHYDIILMEGSLRTGLKGLLINNAMDNQYTIFLVRACLQRCAPLVLVSPGATRCCSIPLHHQPACAVPLHHHPACAVLLYCCTISQPVLYCCTWAVHCASD